MSEEREWMKRIKEENAHLKNQIRLLKENHELRLLLGQQCETSCQDQFLSSRMSPIFPDTYSMVKGGRSNQHQFTKSPLRVKKKPKELFSLYISEFINPTQLRPPSTSPKS